jgi:sugar phosphate isomerase/epimerase
MKIGFASLIGMDPMPFPDLVRWAAANDFEALELNVGANFPPIAGASFPGHLDIAEIARDGPGQISDLLHEHGVEIASLAPMVNLLTSDLALRERRIDEFRTAIDACVRLGVGTIVTFTGSAFGMHFWGLPGVGDDHPSNRVADNLRTFREVYAPLADYAGERGVRIAFETAGRGGGEGNLAHSPELWDAMFEAVPSPALGLSFDPSHLIWLQIPDIPGLIRTYASRIYHFDAKDTEILPERLTRQGILGSGWWRYRLPGLGALDWTAIFGALDEIGYQGILAIENEDPLHQGAAGVRMAGEFLRSVVPSHDETGGARVG